MQSLYICPLHVRYMHGKSVLKQKSKEEPTRRSWVAFRISSYAHELLTKIAEAEQRNKTQELDVILSEKYQSLKKDGRVS